MSSSISIYLQSLVLLCLAYSFHSEFGWCEIQNGVATYYLSPLRSCVYSYVPSEKFDEDLQIALCQTTKLFTAHVTYDNEDVAAVAGKVQCLGRFMLAMAFACLIIFIMELCMVNAYKIARVVLPFFVAVLLLIQFSMLVRMFVLMGNLGDTTFDELTNQRDNHTRASWTLQERVLLRHERLHKLDIDPHCFGFYMSLFVCGIYMVGIIFTMYKFAHACMEIREETYISKPSSRKNFPRSLSVNNNGYERINSGQPNTSKNSKSQLLLSGCSEHC